ncbi:lipoprotein [Emticicia oligotrophica DSM 17448]|uniref:Lipoprotein n=1 Tax=Emticicia oligotrophica (strain DSM 17448 / CIP 109782 / MTCC 6937 / GPTSA100-15) TaxID=929562 RepID=A0ABN4ATB6_EMTOG|nr:MULTISPECIES: DUF4266 domain-containing protein [Emticicia]AFK04696.1 lipoprotein [Emticicia oligotrophica DSM 17448]
MKSIKILALMVFLLGSMASCVTVKEYQKNRINDSEMELAARKAEKFETSFYLYREGASGANGGKSGGGCGCN